MFSRCGNSLCEKQGHTEVHRRVNMIEIGVRELKVMGDLEWHIV